MVYAGVKYNDAETKLSDPELAAIPGAEVIKSVDALKLEVTVRHGSSVEIHPDQIKQWSTQGGNYNDQFQKLLADHENTYKNMLAGVIGGGGDGDASQSQVVSSTSPVPVADEADAPPEGVGPVQEFESVEALKAQDELDFKAVSEISDVESWKGKSGSTYLVATKRNRDLPHNTLLGGFGTGKHFASICCDFLFCFVWEMFVSQASPLDSTLDPYPCDISPLQVHPSFVPGRGCDSGLGEGRQNFDSG